MNEWTPWNGDKEAPVEPNTLVEIELRCGQLCVLPARVLDWVHDVDFPESDITQFKVLETPPKLTSPIF